MNTDTPAWLLPFVIAHVAGGGVGILSGGVAILTRKGDRIHRAAGKVFFVAMLIMSGLAAVIAAAFNQKLNVLAGGFTFYLVMTAWTTVRRPERTTRRYDLYGLIGALALAAYGYVVAWLISVTPGGLADGDSSGSGLSPTIYIVISSLAVLAALMDGIMLKRGGLAGADRISRHLWRMSLALFVAAGSFFFGQADEIPKNLRGPYQQIIPLGVLFLLAFYMVRVRIGRAFKEQPA